MMVIASAGNEGVEACRMAPTNVPLVVTVGGYTDGSNATYTPTSGGSSSVPWRTSNHGRCVDMWAPGTNILAAMATDGSANSTTGGADTKSGTSMAAPQASTHGIDRTAAQLPHSPSQDPDAGGGGRRIDAWAVAQHLAGRGSSGLAAATTTRLSGRRCSP